MAAPKSEQAPGYGRAALRLLLLSCVLLFLALILLQGTATTASASNRAAAGNRRQVVPTQTDTPVPTDTPDDVTPTAAPTDTPPYVPPTAVPTSGVATAPATAAPGSTPADTGNATGNSAGSGGAQPTTVVLSPPTEGTGSGDSSQVASSSNFGTNGLVIATVLGFVVALLGVIIGAFALRALVRSGYGPFLRALVHGDHKKDQSDRLRRPSTSPRTGRGRTGQGTEYGSRGSFSDRNDHGAGRRRPPSQSRDRDLRQGRPGEYSGNRNRR